MESFKMTVVLCFALFAYASASIQTPPTIVRQPPNREFLIRVAETKQIQEYPFFLECEAIAEPTPTYRWTKNGQLFDWESSGGRIYKMQAGAGSIVFMSPQNEDIGQYQCFAENECGVATSNSVIVKKSYIKPYARPRYTPIITAKEGEPFNLACQASEGYHKPKLYWFQHSRRNISAVLNSPRLITDPEGNLWFSNFTSADVSIGYNYVCASTSEFLGEFELGPSFKINMTTSNTAAEDNHIEPVQQYVSSKSVTALMGDKVELFCIFGGTPLPEISWSKDNEALESSGRVHITNYGKTLLFRELNYIDGGNYTCKASNGVGEDKSHSMNLRVEIFPVFNIEPTSVNATVGQTAELRCEAFGEPQPHIEWIHNGVPISEAARNPRRTVTSNLITISNLVKQDTGNYGCNATNTHGYVYKDVYVNVH